MEESRYSSTILDLVTRWGLVFSLTPLPLYPLKKSPLVPTGFLSKAGLDAMEKRKHFPLPGFEHWLSSP
jgi:hypothetical protein